MRDSMMRVLSDDLLENGLCLVEPAKFTQVRGDLELDRHTSGIGCGSGLEVGQG
jgi:hypothetical protein